MQLFYIIFFLLISPHILFAGGQVKSLFDRLSYPESPEMISGKLHWVEYGRGAVVVSEAPGESRAIWQNKSCGPSAIARFTMALMDEKTRFTVLMPTPCPMHQSRN